MKLKWTKCPCGYPGCDRNYPTNLGVFYQGSGFDNKEIELLDKAFAALEEKSTETITDQDRALARPAPPTGAIHNGREFLRRIRDNYDFECKAGSLSNCAEFHEAQKCFEEMATWIESRKS